MSYPGLDVQANVAHKIKWKKESETVKSKVEAFDGTVSVSKFNTLF